MKATVLIRRAGLRHRMPQEPLGFLSDMNTLRGKSNAEVEFGNNLWLGETREGLIADYLLEKEKTSDAKQIAPAISRLVSDQHLDS